jgi:TonB-linked SusC/RagA family outer membrane protein
MKDFFSEATMLSHNDKYIFRKVKASFTVLLLSVCAVFAENSHSQEAKVSLHVTNMSIKEVINKIERMTDFVFVLSDQVETEIHKKISINTDETSISEILDNVFAETYLIYHIIDKQIVVYADRTNRRNLPEKKSDGTGEQQPVKIKITGMVIDKLGEPLVGANVVESGTTNGVATDIDGNYAIDVSPGATLIISYIGYISQSVVTENRTNLRITLEEESQSLEEVVVVAYGVQKKVSVIGSVSSMDTRNLRVNTTPSLSSALVGHIAGLTALQSTGQPGSDNSILYLRGIATINGTSPLILIDGVERDNLRSIDPNEVESISVLKDASATAVFGVRGANGVIIINTKRGQEGKPNVAINVTQTFAAFTRLPEPFSSIDYLKLRNEALHNDGQSDNMFGQEIFDAFSDPLHGLDPADPDYDRDVIKRRFMYPSHGWYAETFKSWAPQTVINGNISGGTDKVTYFVSLGYIHQGGNLKVEPKSRLGYDPSMKMDRYSFRANLDYKISPTLKAFLNLGTYIERANQPGTAGYSNGQMLNDIFAQVRQMSPITWGPVAPAGFGAPAGSLVPYTSLSYTNLLTRTPYEVINRQGYILSTSTNLNTTFGMNWDLGFLTKGLSLSGMAAYDAVSGTTLNANRVDQKWNVNVDMINDVLSFAEANQPTPMNIGKSASSRYKINAQAKLDYNRKFGLHDAGAMVLAQRYFWESASGELPYNVVGVSGRITYNYDLRYFGEVNLGYNGSEQFAPSKRFGFFPAASAGWVVTNEDFLNDNTVLTFLKLRGSVGKVGNDQIGSSRFLYQDNITLTNGDIWSLNSLAANKIVREGLLGNKQISWEEADKYNMGIDIHFLNDLSFTLDLFREYRKRILITRLSVPDLQGVPIGSLPKVNMGEVENKGFEVELAYNKKLTDDLTVRLRGNFSYNRNVQKNMDEVPRDDTYSYKNRLTGYPIGQEFGYLIDWNKGGYWTPDAISASDRISYAFGNPRAGDFIYVDTNGDGEISERDMVPIGYGRIPRISYGFNAGIEYKGLGLYVFFQGIGQYYRSNTDMTTLYEYSRGGSFVDYHRNAWTEERWRNDEKITYPALAIGNNTNHVSNSFFIMNHSFMRFKNAELSYSLPYDILKLLNISNMRIFLTGQNIFTWSPGFRATDLDPESTDVPLVYPITRTFSFGANITF